MTDNTIILDEFDLRRETDSNGDEQIVLEHRVSGSTYTFDKSGSLSASNVSADDVTTDTATVNTPPSTATDVARQAELNGDLTPSSLDTSSLSVSGKATQMALDGMVVPVDGGLGASDAIDPSSTTTPLQDAHDAVGVGGAILLPPTKIIEENTFTWSNANIRILGWGWPSKVEFTDLSNPGIDYQGVIRTYVDGVVFDGSDPVNRTAPIWQHTMSNAQAQNFGQVWFLNGNGPVIDISSSQPFSSHWEYISFQSGSHEGRNIAGKFGVGCSIGNIYLAGSADATGMDIEGNIVIDTINVGGNIGVAVDHSGGATNGHLAVEKINYEPASGNSPVAVARLGSQPSAYIGRINVTSGTPTYGVELYDSGGGAPRDKVIGYIQGSVGTSRVHLASAMPSNDEFGSLYYGPSGGVTDDSGSANGTFRCLQDNSTLG